MLTAVEVYVGFILIGKAKELELDRSITNRHPGVQHVHLRNVHAAKTEEKSIPTASV